MTPDTEIPARAVTWAECVAPLVRRCEVAAATNNKAVWNPVGAKAMGKLLKEMARIIDEEINRRRSPDTP